MGELLCHTCIRGKLNTCSFKEIASEFVASVPLLSEQNPIEKGGMKANEDVTRVPRTDAAIATSRTIEDMRTRAVARGCLYSQKVNPDYPGKKNL